MSLSTRPGIGYGRIGLIGNQGGKSGGILVLGTGNCSIVFHTKKQRVTLCVGQGNNSRHQFPVR